MNVKVGTLILPGIIWVLPHPNVCVLCTDPLGRSAGIGHGATLHRPKAPREIEPDNIPKRRKRAGGPGALGRYESAPGLARAIAAVPGTDLSDVH